MDDGWLTQVTPYAHWLFYGTPLLLLAVLLRWIARDPLRRPALGGTTRVGYGPVLVLLGFGGSVFAIGLAIAVLAGPAPADATEWVGTLAMPLLVMLPLYLLAASVLVQCRVSAAGIEYRLVSGRRGRSGWLALRRVGYHARMNAFRLDLDDGTRIDVSILMRGVPGFARLVLAHVPHDRIDADAREILASWAASRL